MMKRFDDRVGNDLADAFNKGFEVGVSYNGLSLQKTDKGDYYWLVDEQGIGFCESFLFSSKRDAIMAAINNCIDWETKSLN